MTPLPSDVELPPDLRAAILDAVRSSHSPARREVQRRDLTVLAASATLTVGLYVLWRALARAPGDTRAPEVVLFTTLGTAVVALTAAWMSLARGRTMMGQPGGVMLWVSALAPAFCVAWKGALSPACPEPRVGWRCLGFSLVLAAPLLAAFAQLWKGSDPAHPRARGAALGVAAGVWALLLVDLWCPFTNPLHLLVGHLLPMAVLGGAGVVMGQRFLAVRARAVASRLPPQ